MIAVKLVCLKFVRIKYLQEAVFFFFLMWGFTREIQVYFFGQLFEGFGVYAMICPVRKLVVNFGMAIILLSF